MLQERTSLRSHASRATISPVTWILVAIMVTFLLQNIFERWFESDWLTRTFALTVTGARAGHVWAFLSFGFLHSTTTLLHVFGCALGVYLLGRQLLPQLGARRFLGLYAGSILLGGVVWLAVNFVRGGVLYGAAPGVAGLLTIFACLFPNQHLTFLLFFVLPVTLKPKHLALTLLAVDASGFLLFEMMGNPSPLGWTHSADLGGMLAGFLYFRLVHDEGFRMYDGEDAGKPSPPQRESRPNPRMTNSSGDPASAREELRRRVDLILDKINSQGFGSLTEAEKHILEEAKDLLNQR